MFINLLFAMLWRIALSYDKDKIFQDLVTPMREYGETCGYESCPLAVPNTLNVHIVPHTHAEVGFGHNFHQHYTGEDEFFATRVMNMKRIFDFVLTELWKVASRKFTLSDTAYFFHWWAKRDATVHRMVYELIRQGRLVFVGGGFSMSDEASVSYQGVIDQFSYSLRKINATFMSCGRPLVAWQAEVFGHSREFASLVAQMGFDALFINPLSYDDEVARMRRQALEFVWRGNDDIGSESDIFTHKLFDGYWSPPGFCFGKLCKDPMLVTSDSQFLNVDERVDRFVESMTLRQAPNYGTKHIMIMMGHRFAYFDASTWFTNIEKLIQFTNKKSVEKGLNLTLYYSTPPCYLKAVHDSNPNLETKQDDFFPFVYDKDSYAVGMYTSRPTLKYIVREGYVYYQIWKQLQVTANLPMSNKLYEDFNWIMAIMQDHGIVTGTVQDSVKNYYVQKLYAAVAKTTQLMSTAFHKLRKSTRHIRYRRCMFNVSHCWESLIIKHSLQIYNLLGWPVTIPVRLPVAPKNAKFRVYDLHGKEVKSVTMAIPEPILNIKGRPFNTNHEVVFIATDLPPVGFRSYYVEADYYRPKRAIIKKLKRAKPKKYFIRQINPIKIDDDKFNELDYDDYDAINKKILLLTGTNDNSSIVRGNDYYDDDTEIRTVSTTTARITTTTSTTTTVNNALMNISRKLMPTLTTTLKTPITTVTSAATNPTTTEFIIIVNDTTESEFTEESINEDTTTTETTTTVTTTTTTPKPQQANLTETVEEAKVRAEDEPVTEKYFKLKDVNNDTLFIGNKYIRVNLDAKKRIASIFLCNDLHMSLTIQLYYYVSDEPIKLRAVSPPRKQPGVLIFRPMDPQTIPMDEAYHADVVKNDLVEEIHIKYNEWAFLNIRLYVDSPLIELVWLIGPIPVVDELGKDVFIKYSTNLDNQGVFYTDANGRQTLKRIRNRRATYEPVNLQEVAGNLYPITSKIYIEDLKKNMRFTVFNDRSQAGGSLEDGEIHMLIQRRLLTDDVGARANPYLNETDNAGRGIKVIGTHYLYLTKADYRKNRIFEKKFAKEVALAPRVLVSHVRDHQAETMKAEFYKSRNEFTALKQKLPIGIHLLTLESWTGSILLRLENYLEKSDILKTGVKIVYLKELFNNISITNITEKTLGANMNKNEWFPLQWMKKEKFYKNFNDVYGSSGNVTYDEVFSAFVDDADLEKGIKLAPQQIRTFVAEYEYIEN